MSFRTIAITGGAGFIGSHVVDAFVQAKQQGILKCATILIMDIFDYCASGKNICKALAEDFVIVEKGDICDVKFVQTCFQRHKIDAIVHLAALSHVDNSFGNSLDFTTVNILGTHVLLEVARQVWSDESDSLVNKRFLHISTDEVYGSDNNVVHCESTSILQPTNPYAASKASAEMLAHAYWKSYGMPVVVSRSNNVYGPRQYPEKVIPKFVCRLKSGLLPQLQGSGAQKRSFLYCTDAARGLLDIFLKGAAGNVYNIASEDEISVKELAEHVCKHFDIKCDQFKRVSDRPFNDVRYHIDCSKLASEIGFKPRVAFDEGLRVTIDWYMKCLLHDYWDKLPDDLF